MYKNWLKTAVVMWEMLDKKILALEKKCLMSSTVIRISLKSALELCSLQNINIINYIFFVFVLIYLLSNYHPHGSLLKINVGISQIESKIIPLHSSQALFDDMSCYSGLVA